MKRILAVICTLLLATMVSFAQDTQAQPGSEMMKKEKKKTEKKKEVVRASDADIQKCITDKLAASEKLKSQGFSAAVSGGVATLTGNAANPGSKGAATGIAKSCGAKSVTNNISVPPGSGPKKKGDKAEEKKGEKKG